MGSVRKICTAVAVASSAMAAWDLTSPNKSFILHRLVIPMVVHRTSIDSEMLHNAMLWSLETLKPYSRRQSILEWLGTDRSTLTENGRDDPVLSVELQFNHASAVRKKDPIRFPNCIVLSAGFDKDARIMEEMFHIGFGGVEIGTVLPQPQPGNPKPRIHRYPRHEAISNSCGFNSEGMVRVKQRLAKYTSHRQRKMGSNTAGVLGINVGKNVGTALDRAHEDYTRCMIELVEYADYFAINVSSPNTPGLRTLQSREALRNLFGNVQESMVRGDGRRSFSKPIFVKIADNMEDDLLKDVVETVREFDIDGIIVCNTMPVEEYLNRPICDGDDHDGLDEEIRQTLGKSAAGGLSGRPLMKKSTELLGKVYRMSKGEVPLIASGGVSSAEDAYEKIRHGASVVQVYSSLIFQGPQVVRQIQTGLKRLLQQDGYSNVQEAVGTALNLDNDEAVK